ncbi:hypothetical protein POV27_00500 [Aureisphaera galaxeae]|uniref:hypothetical protein n=1 Tax=Aureisphaera galaxeae TaxID=1538023 RepID=UPI002350C483|nr:hypothetical protein [Aureisphaera galaxeae]MDC8002515.1 hypothetical protein [Aureisphaera galaxeae]
MAQEEKAASPQIGVKVALDETVTLGDVSITFVKVLEDSRCPKYVNCMWAGEVRVEVAIQEKGKEATMHEVTLGATDAVSKNKTFYKKEGYFIELMAVNPYPENEKEMGPYSLLIGEGGN